MPDNEPAPRRPPGDVVAAVSLGGVVGAEARYGMSVALPHPGGSWPWATLLTNVSGCLLMGALMVVLLELTTPHRLARPFLGIGVLGGFTTFSTFALDVDTLVHAHRVPVALAYVVASLLGLLRGRGRRRRRHPSRRTAVVIVLMVALGAAVGAPARYLTDRALPRSQAGFPWGTFTVNVVASFVLGAFVGLSGQVSAELQALVATGFCGALSTFSTFGYETLQLGRSRTAAVYVVASVVAAVGMGALGWALGAV